MRRMEWRLADHPPPHHRNVITEAVSANRFIGSAVGHVGRPDEPGACRPPTGTVAAMGVADFERIALERNPTLRQAAAQIEATLSRSYQAGLYPNPTVGYVQEQIGTLGEVTPTASGIATQGRERPANSSAASSSRRSSPVASSGSAAPSSPRKPTPPAGKPRPRRSASERRPRPLFEVLAAQRLIQIHRELPGSTTTPCGPPSELVNVGQANEPDLLQAKVEARRARVALRNAENHYRGSWENLVSVVGAPELRPLPLDDRLLDTVARPSTSTPRWPTCSTAARRSRRHCPRSAAARSWSARTSASRSRTSQCRPSSAATSSSTTSPPQASRRASRCQFSTETRGPSGRRNLTSCGTTPSSSECLFHSGSDWPTSPPVTTMPCNRSRTSAPRACPWRGAPMRSSRQTFARGGRRGRRCWWPNERSSS